MSATDNQRITTLAAYRAVHQAFAWLHLHEPQLRRWQLEFLAVPAPPFGESARAAWFCARFNELGLRNAHLDAEGNALAELHPHGDQHSGDASFVLLSAHLDTVFPAGTDCKPREEGPVLHGPGACDNGAGLAALLGIAAALRAANLKPRSPILFAANVGEEGEGDLRGMRHLFERGAYRGRIAAALALEGGGTATVVDRALGSRRLRIAVTGPGGHSWADAGRANAIVGLAHAIAAIEQLPRPVRPRTTLNIGTVHGGTSVNTIPAQAYADLDLRSTDALELDRLELAVLRTLDHLLPRPAASTASLRLHVERIGDRAAGALAPGAPLSGSLRAVDRHLQITTESHIGSTDANLPLSLGIPALAIGAGGLGSGIHTLAEQYDPTGRDLALRRILLLLLDTCCLNAQRAERTPLDDLPAQKGAKEGNES